MKTIITAILILLLNVDSTAQIIAAEGFFDTDPGVGNGLPIDFTLNGSIADFSSNLPTGITPGIHTLYVRTCASSHLWSVARGRVVMVDQSPFSPPQVVEIDKCEYFIDIDPGVGNGTEIPLTLNGSEASITQEITSGLAPGFYRLGLRFRSTTQVWSVTRIRTFYIRVEGDNAVAEEIVEGEYFIGNSDPGVGNATPIPLSEAGDPVGFEASALTDVPPGIHSLNCRFKSSHGLWSVARPRYFHVIDSEADMLAEEIVAAEYFVDSDPGVGQGIEVNLADPGETVEIAHQALMSAGLGTHTLYLRTKSDRQLWSVARGRAFIVTNDPLYPVNEIVYAEYYIDNDPGEGNATALAIVEGSIVPLNGSIPTTGLNPGSHVLYLRVLSDLGIWSEISSQSFIITSDEPFFDITEFSTSCSDANDGEVTVEVFGGNSTYTYNWDGIDGSEILSNASPGNHQLIVTDAENNVVLDTVVTVMAPEPIGYQSNQNNVSCFGLNDGSVQLATSGGTGDISVDWQGVDPAQLGAGSYAFTLTDENGCASDGTIVITQPDALSATSSVQQASSGSDCDGEITVSTEGGTPPYVYTWTPEAPDTETLTDLCPGTYSVVITDDNGCAFSLNDVLITVGIESPKLNGYDLITSPNPGNGLFMVDVMSPRTAHCSWQVVDANGRLISSSETSQTVTGKSRFSIDLTAHTNGTYFLHMNLDNEQFVVQLIISK